MIRFLGVTVKDCIIKTDIIRYYQLTEYWNARFSYKFQLLFFFGGGVFTGAWVTSFQNSSTYLLTDLINTVVSIFRLIARFSIFLSKPLGTVLNELNKISITNNRVFQAFSALRHVLSIFYHLVFFVFFLFTPRSAGTIKFTRSFFLWINTRYFFFLINSRYFLLLILSFGKSTQGLVFWLGLVNLFVSEISQEMYASHFLE